MSLFKLNRKERLMIIMAVSFSVFLAELVVGCLTSSLALIADAFHYLCDLIGFAVAFIAIKISERSEPAPPQFTYGWDRAVVLGAFFNGVFLLALGLSILIQAIERFANVIEIGNPKLILIMGCVGLGLNILLMGFLHEHRHREHDHDQPDRNEDISESTHAIRVAEEQVGQEGVTTATAMGPSSVDQIAQTSVNTPWEAEARSLPKRSRDLGILGALVHVIGDAINNIGVIISAIIVWKVDGHNKYYADPAIGVFIAAMILLTALPLTRKSGKILLETAPGSLDMEAVKLEIQKVPGVESITDLHIWRLDQHRSIASVHVEVSEETADAFTDASCKISKCLRAHGVEMATVQPRKRVMPATSPADDVV